MFLRLLAAAGSNTQELLFFMSMKKFLTLSLALSLCASAYAEDIRFFSSEGGEFPTANEPQLMGLALSPNGKYLCGAIEMGAGIFVADNETGEVNWIIVTTDDGGELRNIDNNGRAIGFTDEGVFFSMDSPEETIINCPSEYRYFLGEALTNDGSMFVGSLCQKTFSSRAAYSYDGEEWFLLPVPTAEQLGGVDVRSETQAPKRVSADGKVIFGHLGSFAVPIAWIKNDAGEYEVDFFPARYLKLKEEDINDATKPLYSISAMYLNMSNNGKYLSMLGLIKNEKGELCNVPVIYDTDKRDIIIYDEVQPIDPDNYGLYPSAISDDGTFIGTIGRPYFDSHGTFIMKSGQTKAVTYNEAFPVYADKLGAAEALGFNIPTSISADGRYLLGYAFYCEDYQNAAADAYYITYVIDTRSDEPAGVGSIEVEENVATPEAYYTIDGRRLSKMADGVNIVRMSDGSVRKVVK